MPHADATNFTRGATKAETYNEMISQLSILLQGQRNWVCNLANTSSLLWFMYKSLPPPGNQVNWAGFYMVDHTAPKEKPRLILGPFHGKVACQTIDFGRGVCGTVAATHQPCIVEDVNLFPGHIACDGASKSEVVVPILVVDNIVSKGHPGTGESRGCKRLVGIIDIDCEAVNGFDKEDMQFLEQVAEMLAEGCDWTS